MPIINFLIQIRQAMGRKNIAIFHMHHFSYLMTEDGYWVSLGADMLDSESLSSSNYLFGYEAKIIP